jgi:hypothetical protein
MNLDALCSLWDETRDPRIRHLVETLYQPADPAEHEALSGRGKKAHAAWLALAEQAGDDAAHLPALLAALTSGNSVQALEKLEALSAYHRDLRLCLALGELVCRAALSHRYGDLLLRRKERAAQRWHHMELELNSWPSKKAERALLDGLACAVEMVSWPRGEGKDRAAFERWAKRFELELS